MNTAIVQTPLTNQELNQLSKEFPQLLFLSFSRHGFQTISQEQWGQAEVFFGEHLTSEDLASCHLLRWIHTPTPHLNRLCLKEIEQRGNILISNTRELNLFQVGEYVLAVALAFAKNLFQWKEANKFPALVWDCKWRNQMWSLKDKIFLQIGLEKMGIEIARRAKAAGMKVWGVSKLRSFHPYCHKQFTYHELHHLLSHADVVSFALPREESNKKILGAKELHQLKQNSILCILGTQHEFDETTLIELALKGKFRGILLDAYYQTPIPPQSKLWDIPNLLITAEVAPRPKSLEREAFRIFRFNLRQYLHNNFSDMKNLIDPSLAFSAEWEDWS